MIKKLLTALYADDNILYFKEDSGNFIIITCFLVIKWVFLLWMVTILTLMILIIMKMTLKLLFMSDSWLGIVNLKNVYIYCVYIYYIVASLKMMEFLHGRR